MTLKRLSKIPKPVVRGVLSEERNPASVEILRREKWRIKRLRKNSLFLKSCGFDVLSRCSPKELAVFIRLEDERQRLEKLEERKRRRALELIAEAREKAALARRLSDEYY